MAKIQLKRGNKVNLPTLSEAELAFCKDTKELYIGTVSGNVNLSDHYKRSEADDKFIDNVELESKGYLTQHQDISGKVDKVEGKQLSTEDYTTTEKNKLNQIEDASIEYIDQAIQDVLPQTPMSRPNNFYNKQEIDEKLVELGSGGSIKLSNYYTKEEIHDKNNEINKKVETINNSLNGIKLWKGSQQEYDSISVKDNNTVYIIE